MSDAPMMPSGQGQSHTSKNEIYEMWEQSTAISLSVCVCLSIHEHTSGTTGPIFMKFFTQIPCGRDAVLL